MARLRMREARRPLAESRLRVAEVTMRVGFEEAPIFAAVPNGNGDGPEGIPLGVWSAGIGVGGFVGWGSGMRVVIAALSCGWFGPIEPPRIRPTIELPLREEQLAFNQRRWVEFCADPWLQRLDGKFEMEHSGNLNYVLPPSLGHNDYVNAIFALLLKLFGGKPRTEYPVNTVAGAKAPDVVWFSVDGMRCQRACPPILWRRKSVSRCVLPAIQRGNLTESATGILTRAPRRFGGAIEAGEWPFFERGALRGRWKLQALSGVPGHRQQIRRT